MVTEKVLVAPQSVTTDSQQRIIVTDAAAHGVHVFSYYPKNSFQIVGGPGRRLQSPNGVAVDRDDNIYVSDTERGTVLVYDSEGTFVRTIGSFGDEGLFEHPTGIAIDGKAGRLFVLDPPRHMLFILDLQGKVVARVGTDDESGAGFSSRIGSTEPGRFKDPKAVLVHNDELIVLDGTRIHILDLQGKFLKEFKISSGGELTKGPAPGLFMDAENRIYVSDPGTGISSDVRPRGGFLRAFGRPAPDSGNSVHRQACGLIRPVGFTLSMPITAAYRCFSSAAPSKASRRDEQVSVTTLRSEKNSRTNPSYSLTGAFEHWFCPCSRGNPVRCSHPRCFACRSGPAMMLSTAVIAVSIE